MTLMTLVTSVTDDFDEFDGFDDKDRLDCKCHCHCSEKQLDSTEPSNHQDEAKKTESLSVTLYFHMKGCVIFHMILALRKLIFLT